MDALDVVLIVLCLAFAASGYRQGFLIGVLSFIGFLGGGALGARYAAALHGVVGFGNAAIFGLLVVFLAATVGQLVATAAGIALRRRVTWRPARVVDAAAGAVVSVVSVLLIAWLVGQALANSTLTGLAKQVRHSVVLSHIDDLIPASARTLFPAFRRLLAQNGFPQVFGGIGAERIVPVAPPDPAVASSRAVRAARPVIVKITGDAVACGHTLEGSGFLYAPEHVVTNAHVIAGVHDPRVSTVDGRTLAARPVLYDPKRDLAVLYVPGITGTPLPMSGTAGRGDSAVVAGYPENGPFSAVAARVRSKQSATGPDIYQSSQVTREIYSVYARVRPGNSGGPLLGARLVGGHPVVLGIVFAAAVDDPHTGYALTDNEVAADTSAARTATQPVSTQQCE